MSRPSSKTPDVVIVANADLVRAFEARLPRDRAVMVFPVSEALQALAAIRRHQPSVVVLDRSFSATARGAALVAAIKADPSLMRVDPRVLSDEADHVAALLEDAAAPEEALLARSQPLDHYGTRASARFLIQDAVNVLANGEPSQLVDLSTMGAQVVTNSRMRPEQPVRLTLDDGTAQNRVNGVVAWAVVEPAGARLQYRAGLRFVDPDSNMLEAFCRKNGAGRHGPFGNRDR